MTAMITCGVGDYEFLMMFVTGSSSEDGIIVPQAQELTPEYLLALEHARIAYKYKCAEYLLTADGGYWLQGKDIAQTIATVREGVELGYLKSNAETEHEIRMLTDIQYRKDVQQWRRAREKATAKQRKHEQGYVYLIKAPDGYYKIGRSKKLQERISTLNVKLPFDIEVIHTIKSDDYVQLETQLHELFEFKRVRGEWFELSPDDIEYFKGL